MLEEWASTNQEPPRFHSSVDDSVDSKLPDSGFVRASLEQPDEALVLSSSSAKQISWRPEFGDMSCLAVANGTVFIGTDNCYVIQWE